MSRPFQRLHPASRVPVAAHNPHLLHLVSGSVTEEMIEYLTRYTMDVIQVVGEACEPIIQPAGIITPPHTPPDSPDETADIRSAQGYFSLYNFIGNLVRSSHLSVSTVLATTIYLDRLRAKLTPSAKGTHWECTRHRVFFAALIVASKYLNDSSPRNIHWQRFIHLFDLRQINIMEYQMLFILDYDLRFDELEACSYFAPFMSTDAQVASTRALAVDRVAKASKARQMQSLPTPPSEAPTQDRESRRIPSSTSSSAVKGLAKRRGSLLHPPSVVPSPVHSSFSTGSLCSTSDMGSLVDDTGSSSGSSSGWITSDSESESEDVGPRIYSESSYSQGHPASSFDEPERALDNISKRPFQLQPLSLPTHKHPYLQDRSRIPSDTSSVCTVTARQSPSASASLSSLHSRRVSSKRSISSKDWNLSSSTTMPTLARSGVSRGFLSRMWGAAKAQALGESVNAADDRQPPNGLKRLVLPTRTGNLRDAATLDV